MSLVIVQSRCANLDSVVFAMERLGVNPEVSADPENIKAASHVILPGVGHAGALMRELHNAGLLQTLRGLTQPCLGICLGMQILYENTAEGETPCLGILPGDIQNLPGGKGLTIPHMGWNDLKFDPQNAHPLLAHLSPGEYVYFVHSFYAPLAEECVAKTEYGVPISAVVARENFFGCQFHPERSGSVGAQILKNFIGLS